MGIPDPWLSGESAYNTSKATIRELVGSLIGDTTLNYIGYMDCVRRYGTGKRKERKYLDM